MCPKSQPLHIRGMKKATILLVSAMLLLACGENSDSQLTPEQLSRINSGAGLLARNLAYLPTDSNWTEPPDELFLSELELMAEENIEVWPIFFRAAADTAMKLDQIEIEAQREAIQSELL